MTVKKIALFITAALLFCSCQSSTSKKELPSVPAAEGEFSFSVLKVGQADAIIMQTENHSVIIDCGEEDDGDEVIRYLEDNSIDMVDYLFITHFDKDHVGGVPEVLDNVQIGEIIVPDYVSSGNKYDAYIKKIDELGIVPTKLTEETNFVLDDVLFEVYPPQRNSYAEADNEFSLAISVTHGENNFLFTGDAEEVRLTEIMAQTGREYDFLKFPHHGKYNQSTKKFVDSVKPVYSVITCSDKNPAEQQSVDVLSVHGTEVYYTKNGDVSVRSDGNTISISQ